jgi:hypothetical protein
MITVCFLKNSNIFVMFFHYKKQGFIIYFTLAYYLMDDFQTNATWQGV